jgi:serine protease AprX
VLNKIARLSFVKKDTRKNLLLNTSNAERKDRHSIQELAVTSSLEYGSSWLQTAVHNGQYMHNNGFTGRDITIAILDAGFSHVDELPVFNSLWENEQILGQRSFVLPGENVFTQSSHGMSVLSVIGGFLPGELIGSAPDASFWLIRSENSLTEYLVEEDNWIAAAEFADSIGADIINTSLGYSEFNDIAQNHSYAEMDGNTTRISNAADIAASKGMLVVVSAGNEGSSSWKYITAPADADSVLTVGAVDPYLQVAEFSSHGPSSDNQVKPEIVAIGQGIYVARLDGTIGQGSGTSFSTPLITGLAACLWQANRNATAMELRSAICKSADRFTQPDDKYGFGIPDFNLANIMLKLEKGDEEIAQPVIAFPNPFNNFLYIVFKSGTDASVEISLCDLSGIEMMRTSYPQVAGRTFVKLEGSFADLPKGAYMMRINSGGLSENCKLFKF